MKRLYTPFKVNKLELKNRVIMSPMSIGHTVDGFIMDDVVEFYKRRAQGGVGLIIFANMQWDKLRYCSATRFLRNSDRIIEKK